MTSFLFSVLDAGMLTLTNSPTARAVLPGTTIVSCIAFSNAYLAVAYDDDQGLWPESFCLPGLGQALVDEEGDTLQGAITNAGPFEHTL